MTAHPKSQDPAIPRNGTIRRGHTHHTNSCRSTPHMCGSTDPTTPGPVNNVPRAHVPTDVGQVVARGQAPHEACAPMGFSLTCCACTHGLTEPVQTPCPTHRCRRSPTGLSQNRQDGLLTPFCPNLPPLFFHRVEKGEKFPFKLERTLGPSTSCRGSPKWASPPTALGPAPAVLPIRDWPPGLLCG